MMDDEQRLLKEIEANQQDKGPKLVYADWLEENGDERANFIRLVVGGLNGSDEHKMKFKQAAGFELRMPHPYAEAETELWTELEASLWPLFAADCAERVLPLFERLRPGDNRPRRAIEAIRQGTAQATAPPAHKRPRSPESLAYYSAILATRSALHVTNESNSATNPVATPLSSAREAALAAAAALGERGLEWESAEGRWQLVRLAEYKLWGQAVGLFVEVNVSE